MRQAAEDMRRLDWIERYATRVEPDRMDGWNVRGRLVTEGLRMGYPVHGAHRLREAIDAAMQNDPA